MGAGSLLAVIENPAITEDVFSLKEAIGRQTASSVDSVYGSEIMRDASLAGMIVGSEIQSAYINYQNQLYNYRNHRELNYYPQYKTS